jgi:hypothetical protein
MAATKTQGLFSKFLLSSQNQAAPYLFLASPTTTFEDRWAGEGEKQERGGLGNHV